jgi:hypothetical protein
MLSIAAKVCGARISLLCIRGWSYERSLKVSSVPLCLMADDIVVCKKPKLRYFAEELNCETISDFSKIDIAMISTALFEIEIDE